MKRVLIPAIVVTLALILAACSGSTGPAAPAASASSSITSPTAPAASASDNAASSAANLTQTNDEAAVMVRVTPLNLGDPSAATLDFEIALDTHSVDLDAYDLKVLSLLRDEAGKSYQPAQVENKGSGHHREITIIFSKPAPGTKKLELLIKDIAGVKERSFRWDLSQ